MPLFTARAIEDFPIGNIQLRDHHAALPLSHLSLVVTP